MSMPMYFNDNKGECYAMYMSPNKLAQKFMSFDGDGLYNDIEEGIINLLKIYEVVKVEEVAQFLVDNIDDIQNIEYIEYSRDGGKQLKITYRCNEGNRVNLKLRREIQYNISLLGSEYGDIYVDEVSITGVDTICKLYINYTLHIRSLKAAGMKQLIMECSREIPGVDYVNVEGLIIEVNNYGHSDLDISKYKDIMDLSLKVKDTKVLKNIYNTGVMNCRGINIRVWNDVGNYNNYMVNLNVKGSLVELYDNRDFEKYIDYKISGTGKVYLEGTLINVLDLSNFTGEILSDGRYKIINRVYLGNIINNTFIKNGVVINNLYIEKESTSYMDFVQIAKNVYKKKGIECNLGGIHYTEYDSIKALYDDSLKYYNKLKLLGLDEKIRVADILDIKEVYKIYKVLDSGDSCSKNNIEYLLETLELLDSCGDKRKEEYSHLIYDISCVIGTRKYTIKVYGYDRYIIRNKSCCICVYRSGELIYSKVINGRINISDEIESHVYRYIFDKVNVGDRFSTESLGLMYFGGVLLDRYLLSDIMDKLLNITIEIDNKIGILDIYNKRILFYEHNVDNIYTITNEIKL
ncbi:MAG: hypothetical protein QXD03_04530 [Candidatus Anstonellales archaeon]